MDEIYSGTDNATDVFFNDIPENYDESEIFPEYDDEETTGRKEGLWSIFTTQCILTVISAIILVIFCTFIFDGYNIVKHNYKSINSAINLGEIAQKIGGFFGDFKPLQPDDPDTQKNSQSGLTSQSNQNTSEDNNITNEDAVSDIGIDKSIQPTGLLFSTGAYTASPLNTGITIAPVSAVFSPGTYNQALTLPYNGRITSSFGFREDPFGGDDEFHGGIDIAGEYGDDIKAAAAGTVVKSGYNASLGNYITIDHNNGLTTLYGHCSKLLVKTGAVVKKGQTIAKIGSTGRSTGNHLHFETSKDGVRINPVQIFTELGK